MGQPPTSTAPSPTKWFESRLSTEQQKAVEKAEKTSAILASAGSGKTRTLVHAVMDEVLRGTPPDSIVAFTFTKKAAEELLTRIHTLAKEVAPQIDCSGIWVGTIHSWCFDFLLQQPDFYNFEPLDEDVQVRAFTSRLHDQLGIQKAYGKPFPRGIRPFLKDLEVFYNECVEVGKVPTAVREPIRLFEESLTKNRLLTFGAMVKHTVALLEKNGPVAKLRKVFVDEYQDVNPAQVRLLHAMAPPDAAVVVVGDDLQCIYNWRGSDVGRIINFASEFNAPSPSTLTENYRSRPRLVSFFNEVAKQIKNRYPKTMLPVANDTAASGVFHMSFQDETAQAVAIATSIKKFHDSGVPYRNVAVLVRAWSATAAIIDALNQEKIPTFCPLQRDCGSFVNSFLLPIFQWLLDEHKPPKNEQEEEAAIKANEALWKSVIPWLKGDARKPEVFWARLHEWCNSITANDSSAYNVRGNLYDFLLFCGVAVSESATQLSVALGISSQIIRHVEEIHRRRLENSPRKSARNVLRDIVYTIGEQFDDLGESSPIDTELDAVVLTTVHQSKGLEWPVVFIASLNARRFPVTPSGHGTSFPDAIANRYGTSEEDEWRLFYVACSRARERLFLFDWANGIQQLQSPFLLTLSSAIQANTPSGLSATSDEVLSLNADEIRDKDDPAIRIGLSDLLIYKECPFQYALRRIVAIQPAIADDLGYGKGIHEVAQRRADAAKDWAPAEIEKEVERSVHLPYVGDRKLKESKEAIEARIAALQKAGAFEGESVPEMKVEVSFADGIVHGVIDSVVKTKQGTVVRDWKTNVHEGFVERYGDQLRFYVHALSLKGETVCSCELVDVGATYKEGQLKKYVVLSTKQDIGQTITALDSSLKGIKARQFTPKPNEDSCALCDVSRLCSYKVSNNG